MEPKTFAQFLTGLKAIGEKAGRTYAFFDDDYYTPCVDVIDEGGGVATVRMIGPIITGWNFDRQKLERKLDQIEDLSEINLLVDSPGGYLDAGVSVYQVLNARKRKGVTISARIEGLAASAAVMPPLAAEERIIEPGSKMMIHRPWSGLFNYAMGDRDVLNASKKAYAAQVDEIVSALDAGQGQLEDLLNLKTDMTKKDVAAALSGGNSWYSTEQAKNAGLVTAIASDDDDPDEAHVANMTEELVARLPGIFIRDELRDLA